MTFQPPIRSYAGSAPTVARDARPHKCGKCATPWGITNPECVNNPNPPVAVLSPVDAELARLIAEMNS